MADLRVQRNVNALGTFRRIENIKTMLQKNICCLEKRPKQKHNDVSQMMSDQSNSLSAIKKWIDTQPFDDPRSKNGPFHDEIKPENEEFIWRDLKEDEDEDECDGAVDQPKFFQTIILRNRSEVYVTHVIDEYNIFVRAANSAEDYKYRQLLKSVQFHGKLGRTMLSLPKPGVLVAALYKESYYRALVLDIDESKKHAIVQYIDIGSTKTVKMTAMKFLPIHLQDIEIKIMRISPKYLLDVKRYDARSHLTLLMNSCIKLKIEYDEIDTCATANAVECKLFNALTGIPIEKHFRERSKRNLKIITESSVCGLIPINSQSIKYELVDGENVSVFIVDNQFIRNGFISCILEDNMLKLQEIGQLVNEAGECTTASPFSPRKYELCLVKCDLDGEWYRAIYCGINDEKPMMILIDYGSVALVSSQNIFPLPENLTFPCITFLCFIEGLPDIKSQHLCDTLSQQELDRLKELFAAHDTFTFKRIQTTKGQQFCFGTYL